METENVIYDQRVFDKLKIFIYFFKQIQMFTNSVIFHINSETTFLFVVIYRGGTVTVLFNMKRFPNWRQKNFYADREEIIENCQFFHIINTRKISVQKKK